MNDETKLFSVVMASCAVTALLLITIGLSGCGGPTQLDAAQAQQAELGARDTADRSQSDFLGCSGQDSDNDGYVTCTIKSRVTPDAKDEALLCSYKGARGCKRK